MAGDYRWIAAIANGIVIPRIKMRLLVRTPKETAKLWCSDDLCDALLRLTHSLKCASSLKPSIMLQAMDRVDAQLQTTAAAACALNGDIIELVVHFRHGLHRALTAVSRRLMRLLLSCLSVRNSAEALEVCCSFNDSDVSAIRFDGPSLSHESFP